MKLAWRAGLAVSLMVLFYVLAIGTTGALMWFGFRIISGMVETGRIGGAIVIIALVCIGSAAVILWSVMPRFDEFEPPGPEVTKAQHPDLFLEIERVADRTFEPLPAHVYLVRDVNAFVAQRGGILGLGSRRVMGIGLPLMRTLSVDELRAVLAHEMGHFYGGDTKLGPWIYKTRNALARTVVNLGRAGEKASDLGLAAILLMVIHAPFRWFLIGFLRVSQAISRAQEYSADAVAVRTEGRRAFVDGLKKTHAAAVAHSVYIRSEVLPLLDQGKLPVVGEGFSRYLANDKLTKLLDEVVEQELADARRDPYDSHPPLRDRIEAVRDVEGPTRAPDSRPAISLVNDPDAIELADIEKIAPVKLERISWDESGAVWATRWQANVKQHKVAAASGIDFATEVETLRRNAVDLMGAASAGQIPDDELGEWWAHVVFEHLACQLLDAGYQATASPGLPFVLSRDDIRVVLHEEIRKRIKGELSADDWRATCERLGLS